MAGQSVIRVPIADDHDPMRRGICHLLQTEPRVLVVGEAVNFRQLIQMVADLKPDTAVTDLRMGDEHQFEPNFIHSCLANSVVIGISIWTDSETKALAARYSAVTLVDKVKLHADLIPAILQHSHRNPKQAGRNPKQAAN